ncbi:hypothetical protein JYT36_00795 [Bacteroidales bacterium AH-315-N07]|nr:hypothetical protein [Bacteroidales bacterium AH-315-N07]
MTNSQWIDQLYDDEILTNGELDRKEVFHLKTPCEIDLTEDASNKLRDNYEPGLEKGGVLVAYPQKKGNKTIFKINEIIYLKNDSNNPKHSYIPNSIELSNALKRAFKQHFLPIRFHTHPTEAENPIMEILNYLVQANTSEQDQIVSYTITRVGHKELLLPRSLMMGSCKTNLCRFIGFYNGLIAPIEFETHKSDTIKKAMDGILDKVDAWTKKGNSEWWVFGSGLVLAFLIIRYNKYAIPLMLLLAAMIPMLINDQHGHPTYFTQLTKGPVRIEIP